MEVELIKQQSSSGVMDLTPAGDKEVLDLTGSEPDAIEPQEEALDLTGVEVEAPVSEEGDEPSAEVVEEDTETEESDETEYYFGETRVNVEVPDEIKEALTEAGIEESVVLEQLFSKDSDFTLDEETLGKLNDKFGKTLVNGYLNMYKNMNDQAKLSAEAAKVSEEQAQAQRNTEYSEAVGGEEGLVAMESYILDTLSPSQLDAYNAVMESDNHEAQLLVISQVKSQMELADKLANGDKPKPLVGDTGAANQKAASPLDKGYITKDEFQAIMQDDKYWEDKSYAAQVDESRTAGISRQV